MQSISVFEIIKVGIGPSSSHTMGPWNAAEMFLDHIRREYKIADVKEVFVEFFGSLAKTGIGHGTDIAGMMGLSGEDFKLIDTSKIDDKVAEIKESEVKSWWRACDSFCIRTSLNPEYGKSSGFSP